MFNCPWIFDPLRVKLQEEDTNMGIVHCHPTLAARSEDFQRLEIEDKKKQTKYLRGRCCSVMSSEKLPQPVKSERRKLF
jgi:hypothetical protein